MAGLIGWRAFYGDGSGHTAFPLPPEGMVCVMEYEDKDWAPGKPYRKIVKGGDWYWLDGRWQREVTGEWGTWAEKPNPEAIRSTGRLSDEVYNRIVQQAMAAEVYP